MLKNAKLPKYEIYLLTIANLQAIPKLLFKLYINIGLKITLIVICVLVPG